MSFKKILVALDHPPEADQVFQQALDLAQTMGSELLIFHGLQAEPDIYAGQFLGMGTMVDLEMSHQAQRFRHEQLQQQLEQAQDWLQAYHHRAIACGIRADTDHRVGDPGVWICDVAKNWGADLIMVGRRGRTGLSEMLLGSVSNYVLHHAPCAVTVIQGPQFSVQASEPSLGQSSRSSDSGQSKAAWAKERV